MKGLTRRAVTAAIFVVVMMAGLFVGRMSFIFLFAVITTLCLWEFLNMVLHHNTRRDWIRIFIGLAFGLTPFVLASVMHIATANNDRFVIFTSILFFPLLFLSFIYELFSESEKPFQNVAFIVLGMVYIGAPFSLLNFIAFNEDGFNVWPIFGILLLTWMNDTGAYLVGSMFGKTPLLPRISPKKTREGTLGGIAVTFVVPVLCCIGGTGAARLDGAGWNCLHFWLPGRPHRVHAQAQHWRQRLWHPAARPWRRARPVRCVYLCPALCGSLFVVHSMSI
jgi:phosphatidate cytidylyltransferase